MLMNGSGVTGGVGNVALLIPPGLGVEGHLGEGASMVDEPSLLPDKDLLIPFLMDVLATSLFTIALATESAA